MQAPFDPYLQWLGIPAGTRPPTHYGLLGLKNFEGDPDAIARAADAVMARLLKIQPGGQFGHWSRLLNEVAVAKACLLDGALRTEYDATLRGQPVTKAVPRPAPTAAAPPVRTAQAGFSGKGLAPFAAQQPGGCSAQRVPVPFASENPPAAPAFSVPTRSSPMSKGKASDWDPEEPLWKTWLLTGVLSMAGVILAGIVVSFLVPRPEGGAGGATASPVAEAAGSGQQAAGSGQREAEAAKDGKGVKTPAPVAPPAEKPKPATPITPPAEKPRPVTPPIAPPPVVPEPSKPPVAPPSLPPVEKPPVAPPTPPQPAAPEDPARRAAFDRAVTQTRRDLWNRDLAGARRQAQIVTTQAQTAADQTQAERLTTLVQHVETFWREFRRSVAQLKALDELDLKGTMAIVVENVGQEVTIRMAGGQQRYRAETMPLPLLQAIVDQSFKPTPGSKIVVGAFLATDREGNRQQAHKLWQDAARSGEPLGQFLMPELDVPTPGEGGKR